MHVLITGGAGFIGSHLVDHHLARGDRVHVVDNLSTGSRDNLAQHLDSAEFRFTHADIVTWSELPEAVGWADRIYHMAAVVGVFRVLEQPIGVMATNIAGCERLLRAVDHCGWKPQVLVASSSEVYGPRLDARLAEDMDLIIQPEAPPRWNYAISKLADEAFALSYARVKGIPVTVVRLFNTVGPRQTGRYGMVVPRFVGQAVAGQPLTVFGDGEQSRAFTDVRDTVVMLDELAAKANTEGLIVNVGGDHELSINALASRVIERAGSSSTIERLPYEQAYGQEYVDIPHRCPDLTRLHGLIDYRPKWTLDATLDDLIDRVRQANGS
ncbi:GDP-mannose 4,6-dehydratase [Guyparkeria hydrothermalis]|uniref:NAD-dependent epimerase/dehydratase family protein n=1 Tax=Guyparkeria TaxID=2035712 RepID=UPI0010ACC95F|nr:MULTISPECIES: NAD-dependent epimerase/dehydratase family protein [Guyparkeria]MCL7750860.1 GDP-mannose 4,6-dehydratase [Guyparkeria hydrothermalis]TKA90667.1 NAD-dependent epimerase/dehydratase family protein [Guyparkeria sp. SB14A]